MKHVFFSTILICALASPLAAQARRPPSGGGGGGGHVAAPRSGGSSGGGHVSSPPSGGAVQRGSGASAGAAPQGQARPRGTSTGAYYGQAVPRSQYYGGSHLVVPARYYGYSPWYYYSPYVYGAWGIGYWGWDPYWWGYPYWGPWPGYWGSPYYGGYGYYYDDHGVYDYGALRLKVKPKDAEVYADGYYMGQVDDFDGSFSHLDLEAGPHHIELRANGYQPLTFDMQISPGRTVTYSAELKRVGGV